MIPEPVWRAVMSTYHREIRKNPGAAWQTAFWAGISAWPGVRAVVDENGNVSLILPQPEDSGAP